MSQAFSITDLFTIGIGPSSSHTVGPMRAARDFAERALNRPDVGQVTCELFGSLALTGHGHATDTAILLGLSGYAPESTNPDEIASIIGTIRDVDRLMLADKVEIGFIECQHLLFRKGEFLPGHANSMRSTATYGDGTEYTEIYFSIGGGAIKRECADISRVNFVLPHPFGSGAELLQMGDAAGLTFGAIVEANESAWRSEVETYAFIDEVRIAMLDCIKRGIAKDGILPGGLNVKRRAKCLHERLIERGPRNDPSTVFEWVSLWALAVNEENAAGGRVVTAPTNGAAGVIPAVLKYYEIQGEVGVACSMAAAGLAAALGGSNAQVENAAEIGMEHNLGLTCDPIGGLVQIPCIERNTMGAIKAINAAYLALQGDGAHVVSLDAVIETMRQTGEDMRSKYKETSLGGLAVNVVEC